MKKYMAIIDAIGSRFEGRSKSLSLYKGYIARIQRELNHTEGTRHVRNADMASMAKELQKLAFTIQDEAATEAIKSEKSYEAALREKCKIAPGVYAPEIRSRLHSMTPGERVKAIQGFIKTGDTASLAAFIDAPEVLTGMTPEDITKYKEQYYSVTAPDLVAAREDSREDVKAVDAAVRAALNAAAEYSDPERLRALNEADPSSGWGK